MSPALFFGVVGVMRLGVSLDVGLLAGAPLLVLLRLLYRAGPSAQLLRSPPGSAFGGDAGSTPSR